MKYYLATLSILCCFSLTTAGQTSHNLKDVYEPVIVGIPPSDAYIGLSKMPDGELRHYNYGDHSSSLEPMYLSSRDNGFTWKAVSLPPELPFADQRSPISGEYIRIFCNSWGVYAMRTDGGLEGGRSIVKIDDKPGIMNKPPVFIRNGKRVISGAHRTDRSGAFIYYSDDDGRTWKKSEQVTVPLHQKGGFHQGVRWNHGAVEPTIVELKDGRLWMVMRTSQDKHYQSFSEDGGETWSASTPSPFYGTITMPTFYRLADGRLLFFWCNTTPLPELSRANGVWDDVFTNRDVAHVAISEDDGKNWIGMREFLLNDQRNSPVFGENTRSGEDKSVHQIQAVEIEPGKIFVSVGQHRECRKMLLFDVDWIYEKRRSCHFENGLNDWSAFRYKDGIVGHCAYNREEMPILVSHPDKSDGRVLNIRYESDSSLVQDNQGAVWNFPAAKNGSVNIRLKIPREAANVDLILNDRWFNPTDSVAKYECMYSIPLTRKKLKIKDDQWHLLTVKWEKNKDASLWIDGRRKGSVSVTAKTEHGISYLQFLGGHTPDKTGIFIESVDGGREE